MQGICHAGGTHRVATCGEEPGLRRLRRRSAAARELPPDADHAALVARLAQHELLAPPRARGCGPHPPALRLAAQTALPHPGVDLLEERAEPPVLAHARAGVVGDVE